MGAAAMGLGKIHHAFADKLRLWISPMTAHENATWNVRRGRAQSPGSPMGPRDWNSAHRVARLST